ncbi:Gfo/Idh/MocA family protein [Flavilitoribacter nigricans]|uniref:Dehydrogenase n=1 Tax=Flavilitoribacter nigricans (strain ATCC 23147 / DSM 23189 / NBRC 102662 / NCIMB 1420 / SS-2) TaxID=1122177 RepID=A0A2D0ND61_FLAN2|nr:Gfo/Idh/MocA family oxidoreductase [Flavilitoribacter nigricans]PHN05713.1 dehydrogenase [Flavilitoribacter nigricans DSM 23189 = NBRC 102662]
MQKKIGIGIIGTGSIAGVHVQSVKELENCQLLGLASSSRERAKAAAEKYGVRVYEDYRNLLKNNDIQAVIICTHSGNHLEPTLAAAEAGKHVLVEKPLEVSLKRADQMIDACREAGVKLGCIFQNRFSPDYQRLKEAVTSGALGKLNLGNAYIKWYRAPEYYRTSDWKGTIKGDGGAALINQGIHTIDLLLDIMGDAASVFGKVRTVKHDIEGEDLGVGLVTFQSGALGTIEGSTAITPGYPERLEVFGEKGSVILEAGKIISWQLGDDEPQDEPQTAGNGSGASDPTAIGHALHKAQINDFVEAIRENREPAITGLSGRKSLELILKIYESSKRGKEIKL